VPIHVNTDLPAPPGIENPDDPLYGKLSRYLEGPSLKLYYDWAKEMQTDPSRKDRYKPGDGINFKSWHEGLTNAIKQTFLERQNPNYDGN
jgi:hypothetical protein